MTKCKDSWEIIETTATSELSRYKVDGGWLYVICADRSLAMSYVPDVDLQRYQSHLRDAYRQGYEHGHKDAGSGTHESFEL